MVRLVGNVKCTISFTALVTVNTALPYTESSLAVLNHANCYACQCVVSNHPKVFDHAKYHLTGFIHLN